MTDHPTLEPPAAVRVRAGEPSGAAPAAAFVDVVCADHELLRAEFDAIIAANFPPDVADGPQPGVWTGPVVTGTDRGVRPPGPAPLSPRPGRHEGWPGPRDLQARERGPPRPGGAAVPGRSGRHRQHRTGGG